MEVVHEHQNQNVEAAGSDGAPGAASATNSRWNPTKEQIDILENLYKQGIRTPSADQIQQVTARLKAYGHIEGKNVFYWFQNHKARQRQRQKQEINLAYMNRFVVHHHPPPVFPPNGVCGPYYVPTQTIDHHHQQQLGFYPQYLSNTSSMVLLPAAFGTAGVGRGLKWRPRTGHENIETANISTRFDHPLPAQTQNPMTTETIKSLNNGRGGPCINRETLALFPLQPTGNLRRTPMTIPTISAYSETNMGIEDGSSDNVDDNNKLCYDFFTGKDSSTTTQ